MGITLLILIGLLQTYIHIVTGQDCSGLRLFDGDTEVTNVSCTVFTSPSCRNGPSTFPNNLSAGASVGKPRNFNVSFFRRNFTISTNEVILTSGATFAWEPPLEKISRRHLKGFYLKQIRVGSGRIVCHLFDLQNVDLTTSTRFRFSYEFFPFNGDDFESHIAYLTSLPPPTDLEKDGLVEKAVFTVPPAVSWEETPVVYPHHWTTWINVKLHEFEGIVEMTFGYPDEDSLAEFTSFYVQLIREGDNNALHMETVSKTGSVGRFNFTDVPTGTYKVQVQPKDTYFNQPGKCLCWDVYQNTGNVCLTCRVSATQYFNFTYTITTSTTRTSPQDITTGAGSPFSSVGTTIIHLSTLDGLSSPISGGVVAAIVVPALLLLALAGALVLYFQKRKPCQGDKVKNEDNNQNNNNNNQDKASNYIIDVPDINANDKDLKAPQINRKNVLLLASEDHQYFTEAVEKLASFLQVHCMCDVTFAPQQMPQLRKAGNSYCWLSRQIDSADFVVVVTSEAALRLYLAYRKGNGYTKADWGPEGDLFTPGIQHIIGKIANNEDVRNVIMVYFDHSSPSFRLPIAPLPSFIYHLPNHLPTFLHHIHGLDKRMDLSKVNLPLQGNIEELEGGQEWLDAVQQAKTYEMQNPQWFELKFGKPAELFPSPQTKPDYNKQESDDSGFTESRNSRELKRRLSSASNNAGDMGDETGMGVDSSSYLKDYFSPPSMCTTNTAYTIPYPDDDKPSEIDDTSISEAFHRLNHQYEQELQHQKHPLPEESPAFNGPSYDPHAYPVDQHFVSFVMEDEDHDCISVSSAQSV